MIPNPMKRFGDFDKRIVTRVLPNQLTLLHIPMDNDPRFLIASVIKAGARFEGDTSGVAHFLEHMMFRGSKNYPDFKSLAKAFESIGGDWNASTGYEHTDYYYSGNLRNWQKAIDLFADFFCNPKLNDIEIEREVIKKEYQREMNEEGISTDLDYQMMRLLWPKSEFNRMIVGSQEHINAIRKKHISDYRNRHYQPGNTIICTVGGSDSEMILDRVEQSFKKYKLRSSPVATSSQKPKKVRGPKVSWPENSDSEYLVQWSFQTVSEASPDAPIIQIICRILSDGYFSKLGSRLRETLGLVYSISAEPNLMTQHGTIDIQAAVQGDELPVFVKELQKILYKLAKTPPSSKDIKLAKKRALLELELSLEDPESLYFTYAWAKLNGRQPSLKRAAEKLDAISSDDVARVCKKVFAPKNLGAVFLGPKNKSLQGKVKKLLQVP